MERHRKLSRNWLGAIALLLLSAVGSAHAASDIFEAAKAGTAKDVEKLLTTNKNLVNARTELGATPLHMAATNPDPEVAKLLVSRGANVNGKDNNSATPLHFAAYNGKKDLVNFFLASGADSYAQDFKGQTPRDLAEQALNHEIKGILAVWMLKHPQPAKRQ